MIERLEAAKNELLDVTLERDELQQQVAELSTFLQQSPSPVCNRSRTWSGASSSTTSTLGRRMFEEDVQGLGLGLDAAGQGLGIASGQGLGLSLDEECVHLRQELTQCIAELHTVTTRCQGLEREIQQYLVESKEQRSRFEAAQRQVQMLKQTEGASKEELARYAREISSLRARCMII